jgi:hypothetical protein
MKLKQILAAASILVLSIVSTPVVAKVQQDRLAHANGDGRIKVGQEQFKINAVSVKLLDDHKTEIILVADITIFLSGTWSQNADSQDDFDIQITGGASPGGLEGGGKLTLGKDPKDVRLTLKGKSLTSKKNVEVYFAGK